MRHTTVLILHAVAALASDDSAEVPQSINNIILKLSSRALNLTPRNRIGLRNTTLAKPGHMGISDRVSSSLPKLTSSSIMKPIFSSKSVTLPLPRCRWMQVKDLDTQLGLHRIRSMNPGQPDVRTTIPEATTALEVLPPEARVDYALKGADIDPSLLSAAPSDFFELLGIDGEATAQDVKAAYRRLQKIAHPDIAGQAATPLAAVLNMAYNTLMDDDLRASHAVEAREMKKKSGGQFDGRPVSNWAGAEGEDRAVFVDEGMCVGCKSCVLWAPHTFNMETEWGRARCTTQWGDDEETIQAAMETCPVDCIYWVKRGQLAVLEFAMKGCIRQDTHLMATGLSKRGCEETPFSRAERMLRFRQEGRTSRNNDDGRNKANGHS
jgi:ferredoxin